VQGLCGRQAARPAGLKICKGRIGVGKKLPGLCKDCADDKLHDQQDFSRGITPVVYDEQGNVQLDVVEAQTDGYEASQNQDGTWDIQNVPFFSSHVDERGPEPEEYPVAWLLDAVKVAKQRETSDGYLGPLHVQHHTPGNNEVSFAGKIRLNGVKALMYQGEPTPTIFGDMVQVPNDVYEEIKQGQLPYRSVELKGPGNPEILSLALLDHEVPYFRYSVMQIAREHSYSTPERDEQPGAAHQERDVQLRAERRREGQASEDQSHQRSAEGRRRDSPRGCPDSQGRRHHQCTARHR
jgi:hypothetical protein